MKNFYAIVIGCISLLLLIQTSAFAQEAVNWTNLTRSTVSGTTLTGSSLRHPVTGALAMGGATAAQTIPANSNGAMEVVAASSGGVFVGLSVDNSISSMTSITLGAAVNSSGTLIILDNGSIFFQSVTLAGTDVVKIERLGTSFVCKVNGQIMYTSAFTSGGAVYGKAMFFPVPPPASNVSVTGVKIYYPALLAAPANVSASVDGTQQIRLNWTDYATSETGFQIERSLSATTGFSLIATTAPNATTYVNTGLTVGTTYYYRMRSVNGGGQSSYSPVVSATMHDVGIWNRVSNIVYRKIGNVGIGTDNPLATLQVNSENHTTNALRLDVGQFSMNPSSKFAIDAHGVPDGRFVITGTGSVGIGMPNPDAKLAVNGSIHAKEVRIDLTNWPDYVFDPSYKLMPLAEIKEFIDMHHHLPAVPSAQQMEHDGLLVGEMNKVLMQKIEELTLHLIRQQEEIDALKKKLVDH